VVKDTEQKYAKMYSIEKIPIFQELETSKNILLSGVGGGFDISLQPLK